ncbi:hypothetical protein AA12717_3132 [Gluconacetobacter sacchari DSM 12717]|nr:hypothetical protein AA12717_3132 [Gluconacetobacter sacchari DSM 12717]
MAAVMMAASTPSTPVAAGTKASPVVPPAARSAASAIVPSGRCVAHVLSLPLLTGDGSPGVPVSFDGIEGMAFLGLSQESLGVFERPGTHYPHGRPLTVETVTGTGKTAETEVDELRLDRGSAHHVRAVILGQIGDTRVAGRPVLGVVGYDILGNYDVLMDFPGHTVTLFKESGAPACPPLPTLLGERTYAAPLLPDGRGMMVMLQVSIGGAPLGMQAEPASNASIVRTADAADIGVTAATLAGDPRSRTDAGTAIIGRRHRFDHIVIGTWHADALAADVTGARFNMLGMDFFRGRRVLFAFPTGMLYFSDTHPAAGAPASAGFSLAQSRLADVAVQEQDDAPAAPGH